MSYLEELLPEFRKGAKIRNKYWEKNEYICIKNDKVVDEKGNYLNDFYNRYLLYDEWELYKEPETVNWDYIIKNKCLCFFWDDYEDNVEIGTLKDYNPYNEEYIMNTGYNKAETAYNYCRPVRKDEVTFYEDKKDGDH